MTATFDFKGFAKDLKKQAEQVMPEDIASEHKKEFLDRIYDFTYIAGLFQMMTQSKMQILQGL